MAEAGSQAGKFVVDTNVLAYYALRAAPFHEEVPALVSEPLELIAPDSWRSEFLSVIWQAVDSGGIAMEDGMELLEDVERLLDWSVPVSWLWREAIVCAVEHHCSTYETLFVVLAERECCSLLTYDRGLLTAFPQIASTPGQALSR